MNKPVREVYRVVGHQWWHAVVRDTWRGNTCLRRGELVSRHLFITFARSKCKNLNNIARM